MVLRNPTTSLAEWSFAQCQLDEAGDPFPRTETPHVLSFGIPSCPPADAKDAWGAMQGVGSTRRLTNNSGDAHPLRLAPFLKIVGNASQIAVTVTANRCESTDFLFATLTTPNTDHLSWSRWRWRRGFNLSQDPHHTRIRKRIFGNGDRDLRSTPGAGQHLSSQVRAGFQRMSV